MMHYIRSMFNPIQLAKKNMELQEKYDRLYKKYRWLSGEYDSLRDHCKKLEQVKERSNTVYTVLYDDDGNTCIYAFSTKEKADAFFKRMVRRSIEECISQTGYSFEEYKDDYRHSFDEILELGYFAAYPFYSCVNKDIIDSNAE